MARSTSSGPARPDNYVIRGGDAGRDRLRVLSSAVGMATVALLERVGVASDARIVDLGCGGGDVTMALAQAARSGCVVGIDADPAVIEIARQEAAAAGITNIDYRVGDVTRLDGEHDGRYDIVYARFVLSHLRDPDALARRMVAMCASGGVVIVEDIDIDGSFCWPDEPAFARCCELYAATVRAKGGDPNLGLRLAPMLQSAGAGDVEALLVQPGALTGPAKRIQLITLTNIAERAIELGLTDAAEIERLTRDLTAFVDRNDTFVTTARVIQAWGHVATT